MDYCPECRGSERWIKSLEQQREDLKEQLNDLRAENDRLTRALAESEAEVKRLREALEALAESCEKMGLQGTALEQARAALKEGDE